MHVAQILNCDLDFFIVLYHYQYNTENEENLYFGKEMSRCQ